MRPPEFWHRKERGDPAALLAPLGCAFAIAGQLYRRLARPYRTPCPVLCVGNLVAGGAGKTPVALALGAWATKAGIAVHFLSRGYGGRETGPLRVDPARHGADDVGDEPLLLAAAGPTWIARNRAAGAAAAAAAGAELIVMDDGFQNPSLAQDLGLVVIDAGYGFGNGRVIPAGPLRETLADGLARAGAVVILDPDDPAIDETTSLPDLLFSLPDDLPVLRAALVPGPEIEALRGTAVAAFAGIGRPAKFFSMLERYGCQVVRRRAFPDHHHFRSDDIAMVLAAAEAADAVPVTTEKDIVRLGHLDPEIRERFAVIPVTTRWDDPAALESLLTPFAKRA